MKISVLVTALQSRRHPSSVKWRSRSPRIGPIEYLNPDQAARATSVSKTAYILQQALNWLGKQHGLYSQVPSSQLLVALSSFDTLFISIRICLIYIPHLAVGWRHVWVCVETTRVFGTLSEVWRERRIRPEFSIHLMFTAISN